MLDKLGSIKFNNLNFSVNKIFFKVIFLKENDKISLKFNIFQEKTRLYWNKNA